MLFLDEALSNNKYIENHSCFKELLFKVEQRLDLDIFMAVGIKIVHFIIEDRVGDVAHPDCLSNPPSVKINGNTFFNKYSESDNIAIVVHELAHIYYCRKLHPSFPKEENELINKLFEISIKTAGMMKIFNLGEEVFCDYMVCKWGFSEEIKNERKKLDPLIFNLLNSWRKEDVFLKMAEEYMLRK